MKVKLIQMTPNPITIMWLALKTNNSERSPIDIYEQTQQVNPITSKILNLPKAEYNIRLKVVKETLASGYFNIAEHVNFTFAIDGISKACAHRLIRHRLCSFAEQDSKYIRIDEDHNSLNELIQTYHIPERANKLKAIVEKYFVNVNDDNFYAYGLCLNEFLRNTIKYKDSEEIRNMWPLAIKSNLLMTTNLRNLINLCELKLCVRTNEESRQLFRLIKEEISKEDANLSNLLIPKCDRVGYCLESDPCGLFGSLEDIRNNLE